MSEIPPPTIPPATPPPPGGGSYTPPPPPPGGGGYAPGPGQNSDRTMMLVLSYLSLLALIPYLTKKDDAEIQWHAKNGVGLLIVDVLLGVVWTLLGFVLRNSCAGGIAWFLGCFVFIAMMVLHIYCIIQATGGKRPRIPVVTDFAEKTL